MTMRLLFCVALLALATFAFADVGPPPMDMPSITLHATIDGSPVPDGTTVDLHCFTDGEEFMGPGGGGGCLSGVCRVSAYKLNPCMSRGDAVFEFTHESFAQNYTTSPPVLVESGNDYVFNVSITAGSGTASIAGEGTPQPFNPCAIAFALCGAAVIALFAVKK